MKIEIVRKRLDFRNDTENIEETARNESPRGRRSTQNDTSNDIKAILIPRFR